MNRIFIGYDHRQAVSYNVLQHSINTLASRPVSITALKLSSLPLKRAGLTPFTYSRFLVPYLCGYKGNALFVDADMLLRDDICKLFDLFDDNFAIQVTQEKMRFEWAAVMLFNCEHPANRILTPEYIEKADGLHEIRWLNEENEIGSIPGEWNHLVGYEDIDTNASLVHYTQGVPNWPETLPCNFSNIWIKNKEQMNSAIPWASLMANSVHAVHVNGVPLPKFLFDLDNQMPKPEYQDYVDHIFRNCINVDSRTNDQQNS